MSQQAGALVYYCIPFSLFPTQNKQTNCRRNICIYLFFVLLIPLSPDLAKIFQFTFGICAVKKLEKR